MSLSTHTPALVRTSDPVPRLKHVRAAGAWRGQLATDLRVREFATFATAEPVGIGGDDSAPTPMEYVAAALDGCLVVVIETVAAELSLTFSAVEVVTDATMDTRGFAGTADVPPFFTHLALTVRLTTDSRAEAVAELRDQVERRCPVLNLITSAGVPVDAEWLVTAPGDHRGVEA